MKTNTLPRRPDEIRSYAQLQRQIHDALRVEHPEWVEANGDCPTCESYESRLAELLGLSSPNKDRLRTAHSLTVDDSDTTHAAGETLAGPTAKIAMLRVPLPKERPRSDSSVVPYNPADAQWPRSGRLRDLML